MGPISLTQIIIGALAFFFGAVLGFLLRRERRDHSQDIRFSRLRAQGDSLQEQIDRLRRKRVQTHERIREQTDQIQRQRRQLKELRAAMGENIERANVASANATKLSAQLDESQRKRDSLGREMQKFIARSRELARKSPVAAPPVDPSTPLPTTPQRTPKPFNARNLQLVRGIGPALERKLRAAGIDDLAQIANLTPSDVDALDQRLSFPGRISRDNWVGQANALLQSDKQ